MQRLRFWLLRLLDKPRVYTYMDDGEQREHVRKILREIAEVINANNDSSKRLWYILSALRGPDNDNTMLKYRTTCVIRDAIGIYDHMISSHHSKELFFDKDDPSYQHFDFHISGAVTAINELGITWLTITDNRERNIVKTEVS